MLGPIYLQVTWVEHAEYDDSAVHQLFRPLLRSGMGLGAQRWVATLQRRCECLAILLSTSIPTETTGNFINFKTALVLVDLRVENLSIC